MFLNMKSNLILKIDSFLTLFFKRSNIKGKLEYSLLVKDKER